VTIIELNDRMDEGDILAQERVAIAPRETALALETRLAALGAGLLVSTLARLDGLPHVKQDDAMATLAPKIRKEEGHIVWSETAAAIDRRVLALADRPGAFTSYRGKRLNILRGRPVGTAGPHPGFPGRGPGPGAILAAGKPGLAIACGAGTAYVIEELQPEGKSRMSAHAFSLGTRLSPGGSLGA
jgi:methionyl-tRNA formyltransferase